MVTDNIIDSDLSSGSELDKDDNEVTEGVVFLLLCLPRRSINSAR